MFEIGTKFSSGNELKKAQKEFRKLDKAGSGAGNNITDAFKNLAAPILGAVSAAQGLRKLVEVTREFDVLNAGLITATGSADSAAMAFDAIQEFATQTPYNLEQVTTAFIKLKNLGLDPSESSLESYGNTAAGMGRSLDQMIEAIADATTGEFERLKEFGIRASSEGDKVSFTFQGVTTTVGKNAAEIEAYLKRLGENQFAGAMNERVNTLEGAISNLEDSWDKLFLNISQQGAGSLITETVRDATAAVESFNEMLVSGELEGYLNAFIGKFEGTLGSVSEGFGLLGDVFNDEMEEITGEAFNVSDELSNAFQNIPENVKAMTQILVVEVVDAFAKLEVYATQFKESVAAIFTDDTIDAAAARAEERIRGLDQAREESITAIMAERNASLQSYDDQIKKAKEAGEAFRLSRVSGGGGDTLSAFSPQQTFNVEEDPEVVAAQERINYLQTLRDAALASDEEAEELAFLRRMEMLRTRFEDGEIPTLEAYNRLKEGVEQQHQQNMTDIDNEWSAKRRDFESANLKDQAKDTFGTLANVTAGVAKHNRALFEINRVAGIGNAIINTYEGVSKSLAAYPMPLAGIFAATHLAAGLAQVAAIKKQKFGSKSPGATAVGRSTVTTAPSNISQLPAPANSPAAQQNVTNVTLNVEPDLTYSGRTVRRIMEEISRQGNLNVRYS